MPSPSSWLLSLALLAVGYATALCATSPNQALSQHHTDRIRFMVGQITVLSMPAIILGTLYQVLVTLFYADSDHPTILHQICPHPERLNSDRFTWSRRTLTYLTLVAVGAWVRLSAYSGLGRNFTFQLALPDRLVTTGVYRYLQHPSYTGLLLVVAGYAGVVVGRWDTALACALPEALFGELRRWDRALMVAVAAIVGLILRVRIRDEERMLRERFGKEWHAWHRRTARLVPGVY